jgi:hypothetical protein
MLLVKEYFDSQHDRCYCESCMNQVQMPETLEDGSYEVPSGFCGFGLKLPPRAAALDIFKGGCVSYHGCPANALSSILLEGNLLMPGDSLIDGTKLPNRLTQGDKSRIKLYTSPSIRYSELDIYSPPVRFGGKLAKVVLQCRQMPGFETCAETIGWKTQFGPIPISKNFPNASIERHTDSRGSIIPYRLLISLDVKTRWKQEEERISGKVVQAVDGAAGIRDAVADVDFNHQCTRCGIGITHADSTCFSCECELGDEAEYEPCPRCGNVITHGDSTCFECGWGDEGGDAVADVDFNHQCTRCGIGITHADGVCFSCERKGR